MTVSRAGAPVSSYPQGVKAFMAESSSICSIHMCLESHDGREKEESRDVYVYVKVGHARIFEA
ncbi:hypothetical protein I7I50_10667 [Histoplasma capsulatum G186AR]|uniref:Uncharacterized protein n=1 Tax=Ajellomyces capsulatus TaxID=5037 RepID=A0A8H7Z727_AJECA|nr:hypothetical protein I7I52_01905 [Histoplasma capsulatum]QSS69389.1 hypothetical protein I7I50_10667 [Histoplasma capsulatum G186AR]